MTDDFEAEVLRLVALAVMLTDERLEAFRKADEAERQRTSPTSSSGPSFSESIHTPSPMRNG